MNWAVSHDYLCTFMWWGKIHNNVASNLIPHIMKKYGGPLVSMDSPTSEKKTLAEKLCLCQPIFSFSLSLSPKQFSTRAIIFPCHLLCIKYHQSCQGHLKYLRGCLQVVCKHDTALCKRSWAFVGLDICGEPNLYGKTTFPFANCKCTLFVDVPS